MSDERGSSGSSTAMIVVAILGGLLLVGCCGGVVVLGMGSFLLVRSDAPVEVHMQAVGPPPMPTELSPEVTKALDDLDKEREPIMIEPDAPSPSAEPAVDKSKE